LQLLLRGVTAEYTVGVGRPDAEHLVRILQHRAGSSLQQGRAARIESISLKFTEKAEPLVVGSQGV
jgi:hypothetical protein